MELFRTKENVKRKKNTFTKAKTAEEKLPMKLMGSEVASKCIALDGLTKYSEYVNYRQEILYNPYKFLIIKFFQTEFKHSRPFAFEHTSDFLLLSNIPGPMYILISFHLRLFLFPKCGTQMIELSKVSVGEEENVIICCVLLRILLLQDPSANASRMTTALLTRGSQ